MVQWLEWGLDFQWSWVQIHFFPRACFQHLQEASSVSLAPISMIFDAISMNSYWLEPSYQVSKAWEALWGIWLAFYCVRPSIRYFLTPLDRHPIRSSQDHFKDREILYMMVPGGTYSVRVIDKLSRVEWLDYAREPRFMSPCDANVRGENTYKLGYQ